ncbi:glycosyl transferase [Faecalicatena orotica]|uniref:glycosyltransferase family A protein n=1 Tax=Faecalicatena orotica TaxID=1544 RepID=UPI0031E03E99
MDIVNKIVVKLKRCLLPTTYRFIPVGYGINCQKRTETIVISLTTYSARLPYVDLCIKSLLRQSLKPDKIILYLGEDVLLENIPNNLRELKKNGLTIIGNCENLRSHKKYFWALQQYKNSCVITVDDDAIYDRNLVKDLYFKHKKFPSAIVARTVKKIENDKDGNLKSYRKWKFIRDKNFDSPRMDLVAVGVGGVLYPPDILPPNTFNSQIIRDKAFKADDIWLKFAELESDVGVVFSWSPYFVPIAIERHQKEGLFATNVLSDENDVVISNMQNLTQIYLKDFVIE